jgi:hypothetical protein
MNAITPIVEALEKNNQVAIDDETGQEVKLYGVGHLIKDNRREEFAVPLFKDQTTYLRSLYLDDAGVPHIDVYTVGGTIYAQETPDLVDLQHHKVMYGTIFQTWIFGLKDGGCVPRPAPEPKESAKKPASKEKSKPIFSNLFSKKETKKEEEIKPTYTPPPRRNTGLSVGVPAAKGEVKQAA